MMKSDRPVAYDRSDVALLTRLTEWRGRALLRSILIVVAVAALTPFVVIGSPDSGLKFVILAIWGGLIGWLFMIVPLTASRVGMRRISRAGQLLDQAFEITDDTFVIRNSKGESRYNWFAIRSVERLHDRLFLFVSDRCAFIVPCRAFETTEGFDAFARLAEERWEMRHRL
jgi:hypothetical protein